MRVQAVLVVHIAETELVELRGGAAACGVDGEEDGPGDANANEADEDGGAEEAEIQVGVEGRVLEDEFVVEVAEGADPFEAFEA